MNASPATIAAALQAIAQLADDYNNGNAPKTPATAAGAEKLWDAFDDVCGAEGLEAAALRDRFFAKGQTIEASAVAPLFELELVSPPLETRERNMGLNVPGASNVCALCWRPLREDSRTIEVECVDGGMAAWPQDCGDADDHHPGYMGVFPIGPKCARKIPARYHVKPVTGVLR